jgi:hypothetical protein
MHSPLALARIQNSEARQETVKNSGDSISMTPRRALRVFAFVQPAVSTLPMGAAAALAGYRAKGLRKDSRPD